MSEMRLDGVLARGSGKTVRIDKRRPCEQCGAKVRVRFEGPEDSAAARIARGAAENGVLCLECIDKAEVAERDAELQENARLKLDRRVARAHIPERWLQVRFDTLDRDELRAPAFGAAHEWAHAERRGVVLWGGVGRGKSLIAAAAANERARRAELRWLSVAELMLHLRGSFDSPEHKGAIRELSPHRSTALVLDDLDKIKPTEHTLQPLYVAINGWIDKGLPLMVTMNRSPAALADWMGDTFGEALASRLVGYCRVVEVKGKDRRLV